MIRTIGRRAIPAGLAAITVAATALGLSACSSATSADAGGSTSATPRSGGVPVDLAAKQRSHLHDQGTRDPGAAPFDAITDFGPGVTPHLVTATSDDHATVALPTRLQAVADKATGTSLIDGAGVTVRRAAEADPNAPADRCLVVISTVWPDGATTPGTRRAVEQLATRIDPAASSAHMVDMVDRVRGDLIRPDQWAATHPGRLATDADAGRLAVSGPCDASSPVARITLGTPDVGAVVQISTRIVAGHPTLTLDAPVHGARATIDSRWIPTLD